VYARQATSLRHPLDGKPRRGPAESIFGTIWRAFRLNLELQRALRTLGKRRLLRRPEQWRDAPLLSGTKLLGRQDRTSAARIGLCITPPREAAIPMRGLPIKTSDAILISQSMASHQHIDSGESAWALRHERGQPETNRLSAISIELVAFAGKAKPGSGLAVLAKLCRWLEKEHSIPQAWPNGFPNPPKNGKNPGSHNRNAANWATLGGHYGHCHVPQNDHWDPAYNRLEVEQVMAGAPAGPSGGEVTEPRAAKAAKTPARKSKTEEPTMYRKSANRRKGSKTP
jgi:hypothetical protein